MINQSIGTQAFGLRLPLLREGDNLIDNILKQYLYVNPQDGDIIGITESIVARTAGMYVDLCELGKWIRDCKPTATTLCLYQPIFSRNRFVPILRGFLCAENIQKVIIVSGEVDEVGNMVDHQITGVNYRDVYKELIEDSGKIFDWVSTLVNSSFSEDTLVIDCRLHRNGTKVGIGLEDICIEKSSWGLLGMNAAGEDRLKLFPDEQYSQYLVNTLQQAIKEKVGRDVEVMIYGDGAYKDPSSGIWEWADPVVSPAYTEGLEGTPSEIKLKNIIDCGLDESIIKETIELNRDLGGQHLGTTPRKITDLLGSLMDLVSGSGDKGTPVVIVRDYFKKYVD